MRFLVAAAFVLFVWYVLLAAVEPKIVEMLQSIQWPRPY